MSIRLPPPPRELSPNARCHWAVKRKEVKRYREQAKLAGMIEMAAADMRRADPYNAGVTRVTVYKRTSHRTDPDNLAAMLKPVWDGLQDCGMLSNDNWLKHEPIEQEKDSRHPRVEITVELFRLDL